MLNRVPLIAPAVVLAVIAARPSYLALAGPRAETISANLYRAFPQRNEGTTDAPMKPGGGLPRAFVRRFETSQNPPRATDYNPRP